MSKNNYIVIIPAYNEEGTIKELVENVLSFADVCVVNDASTDRTGEIVKSIPNVVYIEHKKNTHIAQAIIDGMKYALEHKYEYIITMDAGLSHRSEDLIHFINASHSDLVLGTRENKKNVSLFRRFLSNTANLMVNISLYLKSNNFSQSRFKDVTSGFRRYSQKSAKLLVNKKIMSRSFDFHIESFMNIYLSNYSITEVPITYYYSKSSLDMRVILDEIKMFLNIFLKKDLFRSS